MDKKQIAKILLSSGAVTLSPDKPYTYASGIKSPIYCDNRRLISFPEYRQKIVEAFIEIISVGAKNLSPLQDIDVIAGTATAGIPWAAWIAERLHKPMIYVRGESKDHGKKNQIEGTIKAGQRVVVIEDLISTGGSSVAAVKAVQETGATVVHCLAIFTYQMKKGVEAFKEAGVPLTTLSDFSTLVEVACQMGSINDEQKKIVVEWNRDPENWGKKYELQTPPTPS